VALVESYFVGEPNPAALKMAEVPEGTELLAGGPYPIIHFRNIYILPGIPQLFVAKLKVICAQLVGQPRVIERLFVDAPESEIAEALAQTQRELAPVLIGSYPRIDAEDHRVMVTVEAVDPALVDRARQRLLELLPSEWIVRVETAR
jgi:molybdopterin-biosynthesis enzyme MoeA-like protein